jgi:hypothetical protein
MLQFIVRRTAVCLCAFGWLEHSRNSRLRLFTEDTLSTEETIYVLQHIDLADT